ncbi:MAG: DUF2336 domain-containing protein [Rhizobiales bacterium]|nr:DUF2336 domain-containing protein [Hyphomicrobiales bacterium]
MLGKAKNSAESSLDVTVFDAVILAGTIGDRCQLAEELGRLTCDPETAEADRRAVVPHLLKLAMDDYAEVRECLARSLADAEELDADVVFTIVASEDEIALPFLAVTPALDGWRMAAIARVGDLARQLEIARRPDITANAVDEILAKGEAEAACAVLDNRLAPLNAEHFHIIYEEHGNEPAILERLLRHRDLPVDIRILQARQASRHIQRLVTERGWLPPVAVDELVATAAEETIINLLAETDPDDLAHAVATLADKEMLTPALLLRAACLGHMCVVEAGLAHLAAISISRAQSMMYGRSAMRARAILRRAGLPEACHPILRAAMTVERQAADEDLEMDGEEFGRQLITTMMIEFHAMSDRERVRQLDHVGRFAEEPVRLIARRVKADFAKAA